MDQFEYKTLFTDAKGVLGGKVAKSDFQNELNELGRQGWELVSTVAAAQIYGSTRWIISVLKQRRFCLRVLYCCLLYLLG